MTCVTIFNFCSGRFCCFKCHVLLWLKRLCLSSLIPPFTSHPSLSPPLRKAESKAPPSGSAELPPEYLTSPLSQQSQVPQWKLVMVYCWLQVSPTDEYFLKKRIKEMTATCLEAVWDPWPPCGLASVQSTIYLVYISMALTVRHADTLPETGTSKVSHNQPQGLVSASWFSLFCHQMPPKRDEAALQEEEELQLAIALSQSEAEEKERMVSLTAETFRHTLGRQVTNLVVSRNMFKRGFEVLKRYIILLFSVCTILCCYPAYSALLFFF